MTKDEFKFSITQQFKTDHAPIHTLMYCAERPNINFKFRHIYRDKAQLIASEFKLIIDVESIEGSDGKPVFQILFHDYPSGFVPDADLACCDLSSDSFYETVYQKEHLSFGVHVIHFELIEFKVKADEYRIYYTDVKSVRFANYDIHQRRFEEKDIEATTIAMVKEKIRDKGTDTFIPYVFTAQSKEDWDEFVTDYKVPAETANEIESVLECMFGYHPVSTLMRIITRLNQPQNKSQFFNPF